MSRRLVVLELWNGFSKALHLETASVVQRQEMRRAYYAGCQSLLQLLMIALEAGATETEADMTLMADIEAELSRFAEDVKAGRA